LLTSLQNPNIPPRDRPRDLPEFLIVPELWGLCLKLASGGASAARSSRCSSCSSWVRRGGKATAARSRRNGKFWSSHAQISQGTRYLLQSC
jgi:hypothetical protein